MTLQKQVEEVELTVDRLISLWLVEFAAKSINIGRWRSVGWTASELCHITSDALAAPVAWVLDMASQKVLSAAWPSGSSMDSDQGSTHLRCVLRQYSLSLVRYKQKCRLDRTNILAFPNMTDKQSLCCTRFHILKRVLILE